ncbi:MAG: insulinase family protein, partial [Clostridiales bacterium]|nr:insulinase family protein [Clostridiales bacterium]
MQTFESKSIAPGIRQIYVPADRFKTAELSISMALPLCANTAGANAAAVYLLSRSCEAYPDYQKLSAKLAQLYGAHIGAQVMKVGEAQVMKLSLTAIHDKFALDDTRISQEGVALLLELLFHP